MYTLWGFIVVILGTWVHSHQWFPCSEWYLHSKCLFWVAWKMSHHALVYFCYTDISVLSSMDSLIPSVGVRGHGDVSIQGIAVTCCSSLEGQGSQLWHQLHLWQMELVFAKQWHGGLFSSGYLDIQLGWLVASGYRAPVAWVSDQGHTVNS